MAKPVRSLRVAFALAGATFCAGIAAAQDSAAPAIEGIWQVAEPTSTLEPVSGAVPFTREGRQRFNENRRLQAQRSYDDYDIATSRCSNPGVPRLAITPKRFKIWIRYEVATFDFEWNRAIRSVDMRGIESEPLAAPTMTGKSKGHWEGDTLIVTTTDISDRTLIDDLVPHSDAMRVTERFRLTDPDTLENRITIEDEAMFTRPWDAVVTYKRQPFALFSEDVCLERPIPREPEL